MSYRDVAGTVSPMSLAMALVISAIGVAAMFLPTTIARLIFAAFLIGVVCVRSVSVKPLQRAIPLVLTFCVPLLIIHALVNGQYSQDYAFLGIPYRSEGLKFGLAMTSRIVIFVAVAVSWYELSREYVVDIVATLRLPVTVAAIIAQGLSIVNQIPRHARGILLAQQSRGLRTGPGLIRRLRALPAVVVPLVSKLLLEVDPRSVALASRGFASGPMSAPVTRIFVGLDFVFGGILLLGLVVIWSGFDG